ncbi:MAG TPA: hypothetical protein QGI30_02625 [Anaerolineales bacterium]|nr:hypothetical protein [Anaerolineales bacterium]
MAKIPAPGNAEARHCPVCDTRVGTAATKCIVCGAELDAADAGAGTPQGAQRGAFAGGGNVRIPLQVVVAGGGVGVPGGPPPGLGSGGAKPFV